MLVGTLVMLLVGGLAAPAAAHQEPSPTAAGVERLSASSAGRFVERFVPDQLERHRIPGAAVSVVSGGEQVYADGYGVADVAEQRAVDAERTAFAPASVAKLLTASAVMQLVEAERIDLDADVNSYLDFEVDDTFPGSPVTMRHLLTHTAGFAVGDSGTGATSADDVRPLGVQLANHLPERVHPPGQRAVYSNYGMGLAGYVVERRSGMPFHRYVEKRILRPLGMSRTTFAQPPPRRISENEAIGYRIAQGRQIAAEGVTYGHMPPHGAGFRTTAADMGRFMGAILNDGGGLLRPGSVEQMLSRQFANAPGTPGMGYAFQEYSHDGQRILVHRGDIPGSFAILALDPERRIGLYASYNGGDEGAADSVWGLVDAFVDRFGGARPSGPPPADAPLPAPDRYAGSYQSSQIRDTIDLGRLRGLTSTVDVTTEADGTLQTTGEVGLGPSKPRGWRQIQPGVFREVGGSHETIRFGADGLLATANPAEPLQRLVWYELPRVHLAVIGASLLVLLLAALGWPAIAGIRRLRAHSRRAPRFAAVPGWLAAIGVLGSAATLVAMFSDFAGNQGAFFVGSSPLLTAIGLIPWLAVVATAGAAVSTVLAWWKGWWSRIGRFHHTSVVVMSAAYLVLAFGYHVPALS